MEQVLLTPGAAGALFIVATTLLAPGDHLVVLRPNYATNIETPRAIGCDISFVDLAFERGWRYDAADIARAMTPRTRLVSLTTPHNPTGTLLDRKSLAEIAAWWNPGARTCWWTRPTVISRRHWREPFATTLGERVISVASLSKAYGLPGLRIGWLMTRDRALNETFLAAKEQMLITGAVLDEEIGYRVYREAHRGARADRGGGRARAKAVADWLAGEPRMEWVEPSGGVVAFPRIRGDARVDIPRFYSRLTGEYADLGGPGPLVRAGRSLHADRLRLAGGRGARRGVGECEPGAGVRSGIRGQGSDCRPRRPRRVSGAVLFCPARGLTPADFTD